MDANEDGKCDLCNGKTDSANTDPGTNNPGQAGGGEDSGKNLTWLWILLAVVVVAGGGFAIYWFVFKKKANVKDME